MALKYVGSVALHANRESRSALIEGANANDLFMKESKKYSPLSADQIRRIIISSGERALELAMQAGVWVEL